jgi:tRNA A37 threonylcarbamoyladenosine dehydratase
MMPSISSAFFFFFFKIFVNFVTLHEMEGSGEGSGPGWGVAVAVGVAAFAAGHIVSRLLAPSRRVALLKQESVSNAGDDIVESEQLSRNLALYGEDGMKRIRGSFVVIVGLGGVGSHAAMSLARSGVGRLRLIDYDQVTVSSLNRHACATRAEVGLGKAQVLASFFSLVVPSCVAEVVKQVFKGEDAEKLLLCADGSLPDFVIDAIDNRQTKTELIQFCLSRGIRVVSCMGAGGRVDPSRIQLGRLTDTRNDPLCKAMRLSLRKVRRTLFCCLYL